MKIAVLTSSIGSTKLLEPKPFDGVDYHAFVDYENDNTSWIKHPIIPFSSDVRYKNRRDAKVYKVLPFAFLPDYDYYFWIDSTHTLQAQTSTHTFQRNNFTQKKIRFKEILHRRKCRFRFQRRPHHRKSRQQNQSKKQHR